MFKLFLCSLLIFPIIGSAQQSPRKSKIASFNAGITGKFDYYFIESNSILPLETSEYKMHNNPFWCYDAFFKFSLLKFKLEMKYSDNNVQPNFNNEVIDENKNFKTVYRTFKTIANIPISLRRNLKAYTEYSINQFQSEFSIKDYLLYGDQFLDINKNYYFTNTSKEYLIGLNGVSKDFDGKTVSFTTGFLYSPVLMPHYNSDANKIESVQIDMYSGFIQTELVNMKPKRFFDVASWGFRMNFGSSKILNKTDNTLFEIDNKIKYFNTGTEVISKYRIFKYGYLNFSGGYASILPATKFENATFGYILPTLFAVGFGSIATKLSSMDIAYNDEYDVIYGTKGNSYFKMTGFFSKLNSPGRTILHTVAFPAVNYLLIKGYSFLWNKIDGRDYSEIATSMLYYNIGFSMRF